MTGLHAPRMFVVLGRLALIVPNAMRGELSAENQVALADDSSRGGLSILSTLGRRLFTRVPPRSHAPA